MRYRIEYLIETTEEETVCAVVETAADLDSVEWQARVGGVDARRRHGAGGFQIRDLEDHGRIVALETFSDPIATFSLAGATVH